MFQFTGLFLVEGCLHSRINNQYQTLSFSMAIKLRIDDAPALQYIQGILGGSFRVDHRGNGYSPEAIWTLTKQSDIREILLRMRKFILIPMRKAQEIDLVLDFTTGEILSISTI